MMAKKEKIVIGSDHAGFLLKEKIKEYLAEINQQVIDVGTDSDESVDYPDYAQKVARSIQKGEAQRGILVCATGIGMSMAANRFKGVRAALATSTFLAQMASKQ